ncbi:MAG: hypothetical protein AAF514_19710 [Verrucomicrobiota bacterium]
MKTVNVWWESTWYARFRKLQVLVDGEEFGAVKVGESLVLKVPEGAEELWRKIDWGLTSEDSYFTYASERRMYSKACG